MDAHSGDKSSSLDVAVVGVETPVAVQKVQVALMCVSLILSLSRQLLPSWKDTSLFLPSKDHQMNIKTTNSNPRQAMTIQSINDSPWPGISHIDSLKLNDLDGVLCLRFAEECAELVFAQLWRCPNQQTAIKDHPATCISIN
jgi:hypothetical protein